MLSPYQDVAVFVRESRDVVMVELENRGVDRRVWETVYDEIFHRLDELAETGHARWIKCRYDYFIVKPQRDVTSAELKVEISRKLRVESGR